MTHAAIKAKHQAELISPRLRGRHLRVASEYPPNLRSLTDILPFVSPVPMMAYRPVTRAIGSTGRIRLTVCGYTMSELMAWEPGPLAVEFEGARAILTKDNSDPKSRRNDGHCAYLENGRIQFCLL